MAFWRWRPSWNPLSDDVMAPYRPRIMFQLSIVAILSNLPFAVNNYFQGRPRLGTIILAAVCVFAINAVWLRQRGKPLIPFPILLVPLTLAIAISVRTQGALGSFWCFPLALFYYFVLPRFVANLCNLVMLTIVTALIYITIDDSIAIRFFIALALTLIVLNIMLSVIEDLHRRLTAQATTDPLTGAFNRRQMEARLSESIAMRSRAGRAASLVMFDVDHFKQINDDLGHGVGDRVLRGLVTLVRERSRRTDHLFRIGGEEFVLLLADTSEDAALGVADDLRERVATALLVRERPVTVSIGVAELRADESLDDWLKRADNALYRAKAGGRNRVERHASLVGVG